MIVDLNHLAHRHWATNGTLANSYGEATGAIYGPLKSILMFSGLFHPKQLFCVQDTLGCFRREFYPAYKENRLEENRTIQERDNRALFQKQIDALARILHLLGVPVFKAEDLEADDLAALISHLVPFEGETVLVSGDKDYVQLVREHTSLFSPMLKPHGKLLRWDGPENENDWTHLREVGPRTFIKNVEGLPEGFGLNRWLLYRLLTGDSSDGLIGVHGIGKIAALKVVQHFYCFDVLRDAGMEGWESCLSKRQRETLNEAIKSGDLENQLRCIDLSNTVEAIRGDEPSMRELMAMTVTPTPDPDEAREMIRRYEMASFLMDWKNFLRHFPAFY